MPPDPIALASGDEDEGSYPLRSRRRKVYIEPQFSSEVDELLSDADDDLESIPEPSPPPHRARRDSSDAKKAEQKRRQKRRRKREEEKEEKRKRKRVNKRAALKATRQNLDNRPSQPRVTASPSASATSYNDARRTHTADAHHGSDGDEAPLTSLVTSRSVTRERFRERDRPTAPMSEDELESFASQPNVAQNDNGAQARSSSAPIPVEPEVQDQPTHRAASAHPKGSEGTGGGSANPIEVDSSDEPLQPHFEGELDDDVSISDVSSVSYNDSEEYEVGAEFYTSSEGTVRGSDSEDGLGSWTEYDKENWQGSTAHLDDAYDGNFDVRAVLRHRRNPRRGFMEYRTVWAGYPIYSSTWEPESHFNSARTLREYWDRQGGRPANLPIDTNEYSSHDSDTDVAVNRRPRRRAHAAKKKKRREVRRDKVQLRHYLLSLGEKRARAKEMEEERYERFRRANRLTLDTERIREKGTSKSYQKRMEKMQQKRWQRYGDGDGSDAGPSRLGATQAKRSMVDVPMRARGGPSGGFTSATTRVSQLNDSLPDSDENIITFRRSAPNGLNSGLPPSSMGSIRDGPDHTPQLARPVVRPSIAAGGLGASGSSSQAPVPRPPPGSYKGAHHREPKVKEREIFGTFLNTLFSNNSNTRAKQASVMAASPEQAQTDATGHPITAANRRPSEARKPSLLVLKPVEDFKVGSRPIPSTARAHAESSASSEAGDPDMLEIPEISAVRSKFNPHQALPDSDEEARRARQAQAFGALKQSFKRPGIIAAGPSQSRMEDPRRRPPPPAAGSNEGSRPPWSPQESEFSGWKAPMDNQPPMLTTPRSPMEGAICRRNGEGQRPKPSTRIVSSGRFDFVIGHNRVDLEGALHGFESFPAGRLQALGLADSISTVSFDMFLPFAWIRDILTRHNASVDEAMVLHAHGVAAGQDRASLDQVSEQLRDLDVALLAYAGAAPPTEDRAGRLDYFVAFSSKYQVDYITGIPPALQSVSHQPYTVCVIPLQLDQSPAPSHQISLKRPPPLDPTISSVFDSAIGKKNIENLKISRIDIRKVKRAAQRYRITPPLYEGIRSRYNVIFLGQNPSSYEKCVLYYMVRIFEGGARLKLDPKKDAKLWKDPKIGTNVFVRRTALSEILDSDQGGSTLELAPYLCRFKRQARCRFWTFGFSSTDPDESIREIFPGHDGLVTFSMSAILSDLLRSTMMEEDRQDAEEGQLTQNENKASPSLLCNVAFHLAENWRVRLHPWIKTCFKLLSDNLEPVCRGLSLVEQGQDFPIELMLELDSKLESLYTSALVEELPVGAINAEPFEEPTELPDEPEELVRWMDNEVLATLRKGQISTCGDTRFHVLVATGTEWTEEEKAGVEVISLEELSGNACLDLARLPGN
ncbi:uncharacterized protein MEPE_00483 [Melanopsichium pennsylvanicum]|uniref:Chromo domain-containing protein n=2 Tax=Melanopsichium pennsylvanicum TaxID=63383 RepID=A0AAJ5C2Q3_9BASI|nr:hypothetical protein BN887_00892 [Melanopsichium pennsylvanicum 4]SNX81778.1 uncharacterized protein MEPE_00483 [Melanopsichium pennsylvanicum]